MVEEQNVVRSGEKEQEQEGRFRLVMGRISNNGAINILIPFLGLILRPEVNADSQQQNSCHMSEFTTLRFEDLLLPKGNVCN